MPGKCSDCGRETDDLETAADGKPRCGDCYEVWREMHIVNLIPTDDGSVWDEDAQEWY